MGNGSHRRIGAISGTLLLGVAILIDGLQAFLLYIFIGAVLNPFISILAWMLFTVWFILLGVAFSKGRVLKALIFFGALIPELIPVFNGLPALTGAVAITIAITRGEDEVEKIKSGDAQQTNKLENPPLGI